MPVLVRTDVTVQPRNIQKFEDWWAGFGPMLRAQQGFNLGVLGSSPGDPAAYTSVSTWSDAQAFRDYFRGQPRRQHLDAGRETLTPRRGAQVYELVHRVGDPPRGSAFTFAVLVEWTLTAGPSGARAFAESRKEVAELRQQHVKGFVAQSLWRHLGAPNRYVIAQAYTGRPEPSPEVAAFMRDHPYTLYTTVPQSNETFDIVHRFEP